MGLLLPSTDFIEFEEIAIRVIEEDYVPVTFTAEMNGRGDKLHARCFQLFICGLNILNTETDLRAGHTVEGISLQRTGRIEPLD